MSPENQCGSDLVWCLTALPHPLPLSVLQSQALGSQTGSALGLFPRMDFLSADQFRTGMTMLTSGAVVTMIMPVGVCQVDTNPDLPE